MDAEVITLFEDYWNSLPDFQRHADDLNLLKKIVGKQNFSLQADGGIQIKHYVGFFQRGHTRIQILPKVFAPAVHGSFLTSEQTASLNFVHRLLEWSGYFQYKPLPPQKIGRSNLDLLEIFINIFISEFDSLFRKKLHRQYQVQEEDSQFIKGKILFPETVRRHPILRHVHFLRTDQFTFNNPLNQIFKSVIVDLLGIARTSECKKKLVLGLNYLQDVDLIPLTTRTFETIRFNRLNSEFEPLFKLAKMFFSNAQPSLEAGMENTFSFLIPLNDLFETLIGRTLESFSTQDRHYSYHQSHRYLARRGNVDVFQLKPDFVVTECEHVVAVLDAKYKYPFGEDGEVRVDTGDLYQIATYGMTYDCQYLFLIYPKFDGAPSANGVIARYDINSEMRMILWIIQVDILAHEKEVISQQLKNAVESCF